MDWLTLGGQIITNIAAPLIGSVIKPIYDMITQLRKERSKASEIVTTNFVAVSAAMETPETRDKIDVERLHAYAKLTRSIMPFAFVEYLFYVTKVVSVLGLASIVYYWYWYWRVKRSKPL